ncbi:MAG: hypothetical protein HXX08_08535 [Chloroflexi bacterium]|uniref:FixH family protein n=1 Tax=Candidatus Chlorohelix allophototropha TaxID=3003348 RepID=A0A8T7M223_9CHLR|nr:hypothetical protein [Chloroflexota bacterium]WJW67772.1 FixH family protein [Chloroflexota bacterium L227-S17]
MRKLKKLIPILVLVMLFFSLSGIALAKEEDRENLPRIATIGNTRVEIVLPQHDGTSAGSDITFVFKVTDLAGNPLNNQDLSFMAVRDYSGQVKKEFNGPHDPVIGPDKLQPTGNPGEYKVVANFWHNGHWQLSVSSADFEAPLRFTQSISSDPADGTGFSWDWLIWPAMLIIATGVVLFIGRKGDKFPVPVEEVKGFQEVAGARR